MGQVVHAVRMADSWAPGSWLLDVFQNGRGRKATIESAAYCICTWSRPFNTTGIRFPEAAGDDKHPIRRPQYVQCAIFLVIFLQSGMSYQSQSAAVPKKIEGWASQPETNLTAPEIPPLLYAHMHTCLTCNGIIPLSRRIAGDQNTLPGCQASQARPLFGMRCTQIIMHSTPDPDRKASIRFGSPAFSGCGILVAINTRFKTRV